jgi:hypothetical protein
VLDDRYTPWSDIGGGALDFVFIALDMTADVQLARAEDVKGRDERGGIGRATIPLTSARIRDFSQRRPLSLSLLRFNMLARPAFASLANAATRRQTVMIPRLTLAAFRTISTTPRRALATPVDKPSESPNGPLSELSDAPDHLSKHSFGQKGPAPGVGMASAGDEPGKVHPSYGNGQSALDKAAHLFFFTEIIRGKYPVSGEFRVS